MTKEELFEKNKKVLSKYIPENAVYKACSLIFEYDFKLIIKGDRKSKWGDFKSKYKNYNFPAVTVNGTLNKYAFLITYIHEVAHCKTFREYGRKVEPHGIEWKKNFQYLMKDFLNTDIFPLDLLYALRKHLVNPPASATADVELYKILSSYDENKNSSITIEHLKDGDTFEFEGETYQRISVRRKRIECIQLSTKRKYLFQPIVEVKPKF
jgi:hypothetical protein